MIRVATILLSCTTLTAVVDAQLPNWTEHKPATSPSVRQNSAMAYDSARKKCVLFGGWDCSTRRNDTFEWDGSNWTQINTANAPSPRDAIALAYDAVRRVTVCTAGYVSGSETWEFDGTNWIQRNPANTHQLGAHAVMAYDSARQLCVLYGGNPGQTWEWDGINWTSINTTNTPSGLGSMAYDSLRRVTVLRQGTQTWEYDGTNWTQVNPGTAPPNTSAGAGLVYDSARQVCVMFAGSTTSTSTWEYDGGDWREIKTANYPSLQPRQYVAMAYDSDRKRTVLFGGRDAANAVCIADSWEYAGRPCGLMPNTHAISIANGGQQRLSVDGGPSRAAHIYWIFGSITGTTPGVRLNGVDIPLNPDSYTDIVLGAVNTQTFVNFQGVLDANGKATADIVVPPAVVPSAFNLHHAAVLYLAKWDCTTNPVLVQLK